MMTARAAGWMTRARTFLGERRGALIVLGLIIAAFLTVGVVWGLTHPSAFTKATGDGVGYEELTKQWLTKGVYGFKSTEPNAWRTPAYPVMLAGIYAATGYADRPGGPYLLIYWIQLLFGAGSIALTYLIGSELLGRRAGLLAALLIAAYPPTLQSAAKILTEPMTMLFFLGYVYVQLLAIRRESKPLWFVTGALFAAAVLARPGLALIALVPLAYLLVTKRDWRRLLVQTALLAAGFALVVSPWFIRNVVELHDPIFLAKQTGDPLLAGVDPYHYEMGAKYRYGGPSYVAYTVARAAGPGKVPPEFQVSKSEYAMHVIAGMLRKSPARTIEWFTLGKIRSLFARIWEFGPGGTILSIAWVVQIAIVGLGSLGMVLSIRDERFRLLTLMLLVGVASLLPYVPEPRYVFAFMPLLAVLGAGAAQRAWNASPADAERGMDVPSSPDTAGP